MPDTPEQAARREIDADLTAAGWLVQDRSDLDLSAGRGIAVREFQSSGEQAEWLDRMAGHIATSLAIEPEDFETGWFGQHGSLGHAHALFGGKLTAILAEL